MKMSVEELSDLARFEDADRYMQRLWYSIPLSPRRM